MRINFYNPYHNFLGKVNPSTCIRSKTDPDVELFPKYYDITPVTEKYLCVVVKAVAGDLFGFKKETPGLNLGFLFLQLNGSLF
jgi:hypothetical protein